MPGRYHLLGFLRRAAAASSSGAAHRVDPLCYLHSIPLRNGAAVPISTRFLSSRAGGAAKSLIEDEADLSDWVSDLKTDSFHLGVSSGDEGEGPTRRPAASRGGRRGRDSGGPPSRSRFDGGEFGSERRGGEFSGDRRGGGFGGDRRGGRFDANTRGGRFGGDRRGGRFGSDSRGGRFGGDRPGSERRGRVVSSDLSDDDDAGFGSTRGRRGRGGMSSGFSQRGGRGGDFGDDAGFRSPRGQRGRGGRTSGMSHRGGKYGDLDEEESGFGSPRGRREPVEQESIVGTRSDGGSDSYLSQKRFDECALSPLTLKGVKAAGYERMTAVQEATLPIILKGKDVLAKARTGTGKTVAFLLPAVEVISKLPPTDHDKKRPPISVVVVCPTRELADQAAAEANKLLKFHPSIGVQLVIGGTRMALEQKRMHTNPCQILVATPGRLKDHMENTPGFATRLMGVKILILDEADRLLDMGFRTDIERIVAALPKQRQTLLFSATVPDEVHPVNLLHIKDLPITEATPPLIDLDTKRKVEKALAHVEVKDKESAYQAWLGYYNSNKQIGRDKYQLVSLANEFSRSLGLNNPPALTKLILRKMGLSNIPGLRSK
uniref:Uncharacterized protein n=1 Tax=Avena sativa TaxID=4498 RepID=A0ACD6AHD4_AVESA